jgi:DNA-binding NtrC family response regulator
MGGTKKMSLVMQNAVVNKVLETAQQNNVSFEQGLTLAEIEKAVIIETLKRQNFNRTRAARVLGIGIRTLQRKLKQYRGDLGMSVLAEA